MPLKNKLVSGASAALLAVGGLTLTAAPASAAGFVPWGNTCGWDHVYQGQGYWTHYEKRIKDYIIFSHCKRTGANWTTRYNDATLLPHYYNR